MSVCAREMRTGRWKRRGVRGETLLLARSYAPMNGLTFHLYQYPSSSPSLPSLPSLPPSLT